jgi:hypothetical protein
LGGQAVERTATNTRRICRALYATTEAELPKRGERPFKDNYALLKKLSEM